AGEHALEQALPDAPLLERVELDRHRVLDLVEILTDADPESVAQERPGGVLDEPDEAVQLDDRFASRRERRRQERSRRRAMTAERPRAGQRLGIEPPRPPPNKHAGREVPRVERLERVLDHDLLARGDLITADRAFDDVE